MKDFDRPIRAWRPSATQRSQAPARKSYLEPSVREPSQEIVDELERRLLADQARVQAELAELNDRQRQLHAKSRTPLSPERLELGKRVRAHRLSLGLSVMAYARSLGVSDSAIHKIELGQSRPSERLCGLLADFGVDVNVATERSESC